MAVKAWLMDDGEEDQRLPHHRVPVEYVPLSQLRSISCTGISIQKIENNEQLNEIRENKGYNYMDLLELCPGKVENYEEKLNNFFFREEIRFCLEGSSGRYDRPTSRIYHRFTLDTSNYVKSNNARVTPQTSHCSRRCHMDQTTSMC
ncbi:unnamed protein product [Spirodela intermedia]|uniref:Uncharacterized protein n=1 Tax=Spirodela intermedia TaxID=51605 RepID=A0A7I8JBG7_SPIIN|nr:unnamed protein product [Spirodela intermedia]CAA6667546.1 unnamed protein product [Spirodela intermedia]